MIISHKHKFIFLKTNKTGGTSVEIALSKICGAEDIITPISPEDERIRSAKGYRGPQNHRATLFEYKIEDYKRLFAERRRKWKYYNHITAKEVKDRIGEEVWNEYYKFCFERNPWDRVVSLYFFRHRSEERPTISEFIDADVPVVLRHKGFDLYTIDGEVAVDKVCRFEDMATELEWVRKHVGIPEKLELPRAKAGFRTRKGSYRDLLGPEERERIAEMFMREIELFGYEY